MMLRPDPLSHGFFLGVGVLSFTRGLGPVTNIPIIPPEEAHGKDGGPGPLARATVTRVPDVIGADVSVKKRRCR